MAGAAAQGVLHTRCEGSGRDVKQRERAPHTRASAIVKRGEFVSGVVRVLPKRQEAPSGSQECLQAPDEPRKIIPHLTNPSSANARNGGSRHASRRVRSPQARISVSVVPPRAGAGARRDAAKNITVVGLPFAVLARVVPELLHARASEPQSGEWRCNRNENVPHPLSVADAGDQATSSRS